MGISYVAEGKRLGIQLPFRLFLGKGPHYADGLCVTGCVSCRSYRNRVRAALEAEREANRPENQPGYNAGWDEGFNLGRVIGAREMLLSIIEPLTQGLRDLESILEDA